MRILQRLFLTIFLVSLPCLGGTLSSTAPDNAQVYFISPADGAMVNGTFTVNFGLSGMGIAPAGVKKTNTGHHHLLVDVEELPDMNSPLPKNKNVRHFGGGQTQAKITLSPGKHTLQLVLGNHLHVPHQPVVMSEKITITVAE